jgi:hypothetical protein
LPHGRESLALKRRPTYGVLHDQPGGVRAVFPYLRLGRPASLAHDEGKPVCVGLVQRAHAGVVPIEQGAVRHQLGADPFVLLRHCQKLPLNITPGRHASRFSNQ